MKEIDLQTITHIHFIGVGGIGISAIARMMALLGKKVTANDLDEFEAVAALRAFGVDTSIGTTIDLIPSNTELVVYSIAWNTLAPDLLKHVKERGIPMLSYPEILRVVSKEKYTIAVSGTHGKTTTTAMIAKVLIDAHLDPTVVVGSFLQKEKSNFIAGKSNYFVVEACEYRRSFLHIHPNILVITNIDDDHLDYYKDIADIQSAFKELASRLSSTDFLICDPHDKRVAPVLSDLLCTVLDYTSVEGFSDIKLPGVHNKKNAAAALIVAGILGVEKITALTSLNTFKGTWRRFEYKGKVKGGADVYDDYAHHPTEIHATLSLARELFPKKKIVAVFQPHLYSRTKDHKEHFKSAFVSADSVYVLPIYAAREPVDDSISSEMVVESIKEVRPGDVRFFDSFDDVAVSLAPLSDETVIVLMGAGDITYLGEIMINHKNRNEGVDNVK